MNNTYLYENLKVGMEIKNYKELCNILGCKVGNSNSKKAQFSEWERHFEYAKQGHKFIITEIYNDPIEKVENRGGANNTVKYIEHIEKLILDLLAQKGAENHIFLSKNNLLKELKMINENYTKGKYKPFKLSKQTSISKDEIDEFFSTSDSMLERNLESALNNLRSKALIIWNQAVTIAKIDTYVPLNHNLDVMAIKHEVEDNYGDITVDFTVTDTHFNIDHRKADEMEKQIILYTEHEVLEDLNLNSIHEAFKKNKQKEFYSKVYDKLFNDYNIYMYYNSYEITFNIEHIEKKIADIESLKLMDNVKISTQNELNNEIKNQLNKNAKSRHNKAIEISKSVDESELDKRYLMRKDESYLNNSSMLINMMVNTVKIKK